MSASFGPLPNVLGEPIAVFGALKGTLSDPAFPLTLRVTIAA